MRRIWIIRSLLGLAATAGLVLVSCGESDQVGLATSEESTPLPTDEASQSTSPARPDKVAVEQIPGDEPERVPSALDDMEDPSFPTPLVDPDEIMSGGPPPDGIPALDEPLFQVASSVDWIDDSEPVLLVEMGGEARAYPVQIMTWHEIVNDTFDQLPVTVSYCPLCNSAIGYVRQVDGRTLDFGTSGRLFNSSLVMYDRQTESLWSHFTGQAVIGTLTGTTMERFPVSTVSWATFLEAHPDSLVLSRDTGFNRDYGRNPYPGYDNVNQTPLLFEGPPDDRLPPQTRVVAVRGEDESLAIPLDELAETSVFTTTIDGEPLVALHAPGTASALDAATVAEGRDVGTVGVYVPEVDGTVLNLELDGEGMFTDADTGTTFSILGVGSGGELDGARLQRLEHLDTFWFAIAAFEPDTRILRP